MEKYKIGQLSKTMGVSTHLLKHYEKFDLVTPIKDDSTNYRYYDIGQCSRIICSKMYRNMGFSLKDTATLLNEVHEEPISQIVEQRIQEIDEQMKELEQQKRYALQFQKDCKELEYKLDKWYIEEMETFYFLEQTNNRELIEDCFLKEDEKNILDYVPIAKSMMLIKQESFYSDEIFYHWGLSMETSLVDGEHFMDNPNMRKIEGQRAFVTYLKVEGPYTGNFKLVNAIKEKYQQFDDYLTSDVYAKRIVTETTEDSRIQYFAIYIPLKPVGGA